MRFILLPVHRRDRDNLELSAVEAQRRIRLCILSHFNVASALTLLSPPSEKTAGPGGTFCSAVHLQVSFS